MKLEQNTIVTVEQLSGETSNTYLVECEIGDQVLLNHPLMIPNVFLRVAKSRVNQVQSTLKDSVERAIDYAKTNSKYLDYNSTRDLEAIGLYFAIRKDLSPGLKNLLANVNGVIASHKFNSSLDAAMEFIQKNSDLLDDYNHMWFTNFKDIFAGKDSVKTKKQRTAIFNIAGSVLPEFENPVASAGK